MLYKSIKFIAPLSLVVLAGCANPPNTTEFRLDPALAEYNRQNAARIQQEDRDRDHIERMRRAEAIEKATRNMPDTVALPSSNTVIIAR